MTDKKEKIWIDEIINYPQRKTRSELFRTGQGTVNEQSRNKRPRKQKKHEGNISRRPRLATPYAEYQDAIPPNETRHIHVAYGAWGSVSDTVEKCKTPKIRHYRIRNKPDRDPIRKFKLTLDAFSIE